MKLRKRLVLPPSPALAKRAHTQSARGPSVDSSSEEEEPVEDRPLEVQGPHQRHKDTTTSQTTPQRISDSMAGSLDEAQALLDSLTNTDSPHRPEDNLSTHQRFLMLAELPTLYKPVPTPLLRSFHQLLEQVCSTSFPAPLRTPCLRSCPFPSRAFNQQLASSPEVAESQ